jgi:translation initiation factor eIF-2B subunit beta
VLVGAHAVLANGGVIAPAGIHMVALAAKRHSVPFVVLVGLHKLSPLFPHDPDVTFNGKHTQYWYYYHLLDQHLA